MLRVNIVALALLWVGPASSQPAACARPETPACAIATVPFPKDKDADDCRKDMLRYRDNMDVYAICLGKTSADEEKAARDAYEDIRVKYNRRARGELGN